MSQNYEDPCLLVFHGVGETRVTVRVPRASAETMMNAVREQMAKGVTGRRTIGVELDETMCVVNLEQVVAVTVGGAET
jgi:hypothetical protein